MFLNASFVAQKKEEQDNLHCGHRGREYNCELQSPLTSRRSCNKFTEQLQ